MDVSNGGRRLHLPWRTVGAAFVWNAFGLGAPGLIAIAIIPPTIKSLGAETFGLVSILWGLLIASSAFDLGMGRALTRKVSVGDSDSLVQRRLAIVSLGSALAVGGLISIVILAVGVAFFATKVGEIRDLAGSYALLLVLLACIPLQACNVVARGYYEGRGDFLRSNAQRVLVNVLTVVAPLGSHLLTGGLKLAIVLFFGVRLFFVGLFFFSVWRRGMGGPGPQMRGELLSLLGFGSIFSVESLMKALLTQADKFFLWSVAGAVTVTIYAVPFDLNAQLLLPLGALTTAVFPTFCGEMSASRAFAMARRYAAIACSLYAVIPILVFIFSESLLTVWLSEAMDGRMPDVLSILSLGIPFYVISSVMTVFLHARGCVKYTLIMTVVSGGISLPVMVLLWSMGQVTLFAAYWCIKYVIESVALYVIARKVSIR